MGTSGCRFLLLRAYYYCYSLSLSSQVLVYYQLLRAKCVVVVVAIYVSAHGCGFGVLGFFEDCVQLMSFLHLISVLDSIVSMYTLPAQLAYIFPRSMFFFLLPLQVCPALFCFDLLGVGGEGYQKKMV